MEQKHQLIKRNLHLSEKSMLNKLTLTIISDRKNASMKNEYQI